MVIILGTLSGYSLDTTLGSCQFSTVVTGRRFHGTFYQCRLDPGSSVSTVQKLSYSRGRAQWGEDSYSTEGGYLYLPGAGSSMLRNSGESIWQSGDRKIAVEFDISLTAATDRTIEGSLDARIMLIIPLRQPK